MFLKQNIRIISEGSRDTEAWSTEVENSALITARVRTTGELGSP